MFRTFRPALYDLQDSCLPAVLHNPRQPKSVRYSSFDHVNARRIKICLSAYDPDYLGQIAKLGVLRSFWAFVEDLIEKAKGLGFLSGHVGIAIKSFFNGFDGLTGVLGVNLIQPAL